MAGQARATAAAGSDPPSGRSHFEESIGYIPTLSIFRGLGELPLLDFEIAFDLGYILNGVSDIVESQTDLHRLWARYSTEKVELRLGRQKIAFGPGRVLRPLEWFDTLDPKDPTGQTKGVTAARVRYFMPPKLSFWAWLVRPDNPDIAAPGARVEYTFPLAEAALTVHHRPALTADGVRPAGIALLPEATAENRLAFDIRADVKIGIWSEVVIARAVNPIPEEPDARILAMAGGDYTFPWGSGLYVMVEHLADFTRVHASTGRRESHLSALLVDYPIGIFDRLFAILVYNWEEEHLSKYLRWQRTYDNYTFNIILFANPDRKSFATQLQEPLPETLAAFGYGVQFMLIYNH